MPVVYPGGGPQITVEALLKQPRMIARALTDLVRKRFVADRVLIRGSSDQVAGGAALFQRSESIYTDRDAEEVGVRSGYPRASWTEELFAAAVRKFGLEVPISDEARRRNQLDVVVRAQRKLANVLTRFVDALLMVLLNDTTQGINTQAASGDWTTAATDIIFDIATAKATIANVDEGYEADTLIVHPNQELDLILDLDLRNAMPREGGAPQPSVLTGRAVPILGLNQILVSNAQTAGVVTVMESGMAGTIAEEAPIPDENYVAYTPGPNMMAVYVKMYREEGTDETIVRGARFPAMWIAEPKAITKITGA